MLQHDHGLLQLRQRMQFWRLHGVSVIRTAALAFALAIATSALGARHRSSAVRREFQHSHPCPSNGKLSGPCPGWVRDHVIPLCRGGADSVDNLQWQTVADAKRKDRTECRTPARRRHK